jgi:predicted nucleic acid-binding protein
LQGLVSASRNRSFWKPNGYCGGFTASVEAQVAAALTALVALPNVRCEDEPAVVAALEWATHGLDFADALHLASARSANAFVTFDADLVRRAGSVAIGIAVRSP